MFDVGLGPEYVSDKHFVYILVVKTLLLKKTT